MKYNICKQLSIKTMINYNNNKKFGQTVSLNFNFAYVEMFYIEEIIESTTQDKVTATL